MPFLDPLNAMMDTSLPLTNTEQLEWGNPIKDKSIYCQMKNYSPYENLSSQTLKSTDIWITAGLQDERVPLWQSLKYTRRIRQLSNQNHGNLALYISNRAHNHGQHDEIQELALELSFLIKSLNSY